MKKAVVLAGAALFAAGVMAAEPMIVKGTHELSLSGNLDRDTVALGVGYGYFIMDGLEIGADVAGSYEDMGDNSKIKLLGGDIFAQYNFKIDAPVVPFVGVAGGIRYVKVEVADWDEDETAVLGEAQLGVKYFVADNVAIALYGFYDVSDKEIFTNKDEMEKYDFGARLGMNTYF